MIDCTTGRWCGIHDRQEGCHCPELQAWCERCRPAPEPGYVLGPRGQFVLSISRLEGSFPLLNEADQAALLAELVPLGRVALRRASRRQRTASVALIGRVTA